MSSGMTQHQTREGTSDSQNRLSQGFMGCGALSPLDVDAAALIRRALNRSALPAKPLAGLYVSPQGFVTQPGRERQG